MAEYDLLIAPGDIRAAQREFEAALEAGLRVRPGTYAVGYRGGREEAAKLRANGSIWFFGRTLHPDKGHPKYWNAFGLTSTLNQQRSNGITVEINSPLQGSVPAIAGMFAKDRNGKVALLHSGKVGGGKKDIGKAEFVAAFKGSSVSVTDPTRVGVVREAFVVARLDDVNAIRDLGRFVLAVALFKSGNASIARGQRALEALRARANAAPPKPGSRLREVVEFVRNPYVVAYAKGRAKGRCDLCAEPAPFEVDGEPFLECHHIQMLADNGDDLPSNTVALCPNCHRRMHFAPTEKDFELLRKRAAR